MIVQAILRSFAFSTHDVQQIGVGVTAFLITCALLFVFLFARHDRIGRTVSYVLAALFAWGWCGFLYSASTLAWLGRDFRIGSSVGALFVSLTLVHFAATFLEEVRPLSRVERLLQRMGIAFNIVFLATLALDLFAGTQLLVGSVDGSPRTVVAPHAGPLLGLFIVVQTGLYWFAGILLAQHARHARDTNDRRRATILFVGVTLGLSFVSTRWLPWYGINALSLIGVTGIPLFIASLLYAVKKYRMFNIQLASAQLLVGTLWTFTFFRAILQPSLRAALPDIFILLIVIVVGLFLIYLVSRELRERRELESISADLRHLNEHLEQEVIERTDALVKEKTQFITIAAHQLRTPIAGLRWALDFLSHENGSSFSEAQRAVIHKGGRAAVNMARIVNDLLNVAQMSAGKFTFTFASANVCDILADAVGTFDAAARERTLSLVATCTPESMTAVVDAHKLKMAIENCIDNAVKYTLPGGEVRVSADLPDGTYVRITISDTGVGVSEADRTHIFDQFFRSKRATQLFTDGSGIGLSVAKAIIEGHRGTLGVASEEGKGTTITINIPLPKPAVSQHAA